MNLDLVMIYILELYLKLHPCFFNHCSIGISFIDLTCFLNLAVYNTGILCILNVCTRPPTVLLVYSRKGQAFIKLKRRAISSVKTQHKVLIEIIIRA